jgi:hypothetical protein
MVLWEFEKPSTWSMGKRIGFFGIVLLIIGPFLPYIVLVDAFGHEEIIIFLDYEWNRLWMFLPHLSAILFICLFYVKFELYLVKDQEQIAIKPLIVMMWGSLLFLTYLVDAYRLGSITGSGFWLIILGFFLCVIAGFLEWRNPSAKGPQILFRGNKVSKASSIHKMDPPPQIATSVESKNTNPTISREGSEKIILTREDYGQTRDTLPTIEKKKNVINRDLKTEEEKTLSRWWRHISKDGRTYEQCLKCGKYVFISAVDEGKTIGFRCPECGASYTLKK